jgi:hypothetical protein
VKVGSLVSYIGPWIPGIFPEDKTREPCYGIIIEMGEHFQGTNICVHWLEPEETFWHEEIDLRVLSE